MRFFRKEKIKPKNFLLQSYMVSSFYDKINLLADYNIDLESLHI